MCKSLLPFPLVNHEKALFKPQTWRMFSGTKRGDSETLALILRELPGVLELDELHSDQAIYFS